MSPQDPSCKNARGAPRIYLKKRHTLVDYKKLIGCHLHSACQSALGDTPVVLLARARQTGKSTLAKQLVRALQVTMPFLTLDGPATLGAAKRGPDAVLEDAGARCLIDEAQRAPELFLPMKKRVDAERLPGRYLLKGSANVLTLPKIAYSLAVLASC